MGRSGRSDFDRFDASEAELELQLSSLLNPVQPNQEFVKKLRTRLSTQPAIVIENRSHAAAFIVIALGLFFGALVAWIVFGIRALLLRRPAV